MGEKRAYKPRRPGGGRRKSKPEYDAGKILRELMDPAVVLYEAGMSLQAIADELGLNPIKVRKLLIFRMWRRRSRRPLMISEKHRIIKLLSFQLQLLLACPGPLLLHIFRTKKVCIFQAQHRQIRLVLEPNDSGGTER